MVSHFEPGGVEPRATPFDDLLARARAADDCAITQLWRAHQPGLLRWLRAAEPGAAEDLASDTWIDTLRAVATFSGDDADFRSLLFTIARRRLIDHRRRSGRRPDAVCKSPPEVRTPSDASELTVRADEARRAVSTIVTTLPPAQAEVVLLRVLGQLDVAQVAEIIGKSPEAVRVLQHRGLRNLAATTSSAPSKEISAEV